MPITREIISGNQMPDQWITIFENPALAIRNVSIDTVAITNAEDLQTTFRLRVDGVVVFARLAPANHTTSYEPDIVLKPGAILEAQAEDADRLDVYAIGRRDTAFNHFGMYLLPGVKDIPQLIYTHPSHAGRRILVHSVVASRVSGTDPVEVHVYAQTSRGQITLLAGRVTGDNFVWIGSDALIEAGDTLWTIADKDAAVDIALIWQVEI